MYMFKYILKRIGLMLMTFAIIVTLCFVLVKLLPYSTKSGFNEDINKIQELYKSRGYDKPILYQLFLYIKRIIVEGDFGIGTNMYYYKPVAKIFGEFLPPTILINLYSSLIAIPIGIGLGIFAALKKNKWQDHVISTGVMLLISVPSFVYGVLILYFLCFKTKLFPLSMNSGYDYFSFSMFRSMFPAILSLSLGSIAGYTRYTRAELTEVLTSEFMLLARTKGLTKSQATVRHALRNAMVPIFPSIIGEFIGVLQGSLVIENIFAIPGVGGLYLQAISVKDYDFFMFISAFYTLVGLAAGLVIDLSYGIIDPRIRMGAK